MTFTPVAAASAPVRSLDPSLTTMISKGTASASRVSRTLAIEASMISSSLKAGTITDIPCSRRAAGTPSGEGLSFTTGSII